MLKATDPAGIADVKQIVRTRVARPMSGWTGVDACASRTQDGRRGIIRLQLPRRDLHRNRNDHPQDRLTRPAACQVAGLGKLDGC